MNGFTAIAAMSLNRVIGNGNRIPWHLPEDFQWFKAATTGHVIVMGRKTFESIGKPLPHRETIVLSRSTFAHPGVTTLRNLSELTEWAKNPSPDLSATLPRNPGVGQAPCLSSGAGKMDASPDRRDACPTTDGARAGVRGMPANRQVFICGGAQIYEQALPLCSELLLTLVKREVDGDTFFPKFEDQFELAEQIRDTREFKILRYRRRSPV